MFWKKKKESKPVEISFDDTNYLSWIQDNMYQVQATDVHTGDSVGTYTNAYNIGRSSVDLRAFTHFVEQGFIGYQVCAILMQNGMINKVCAKPAKAAIKNGFELANMDEGLAKELHSHDKKYNIVKNLIEYEYFKRGFGVRVAMLRYEGADYSKPFNIDAIRKGQYLGISQIDPYWMTPIDVNASNPSAIDYYKPKKWNVAGEDIHHSHLIITVTKELPDILKPTYNYGGLPLTQEIYKRVYAAERTANEAPMLASSKRTRVMTTDISAMMSDKAAFDKRMRSVSEFSDNYGVMPKGEGEDYQQHDTSLADLDAVIMTQYQLVASIAGIPASELLETTPKGFNATGEGERKSYHATLESIQSDSFEPLLDRHYQALQKHLGKAKVEEVCILWPELDSPSALESAQIREADMRTATGYQAGGALSADDVRNTLAADKDSGFNIEPVEDDEADYTEYDSKV